MYEILRLGPDPDDDFSPVLAVDDEITADTIAHNLQHSGHHWRWVDITEI